MLTEIKTWLAKLGKRERAFFFFFWSMVSPSARATSTVEILRCDHSPSSQQSHGVQHVQVFHTRAHLRTLADFRAPVVDVATGSLHGGRMTKRPTPPSAAQAGEHGTPRIIDRYIFRIGAGAPSVGDQYASGARCGSATLIPSPPFHPTTPAAACCSLLACRGQGQKKRTIFQVKGR